MAKVQRTHVQRILQGIEELLNQEMVETPAPTNVVATRQGGRIMYVALPGSARKNPSILSNRAKQVLDAINRKRKATADVLQGALDVNRNVIAGAVHELKQRRFIRAVPVAGELAVAAGAPRHSSDDRPRRARKTNKKTRNK